VSLLARALLAALPVAVVFVLMVWRGWGGSKAGPVGWLMALVVASVGFGAGPELLLYSQAKSILLSLFVLYIVWFALALSSVVREAGALDTISAGVARLTADRTIQLLMLSWVFASFVQGVTGFGVPVAVVAPLLIGLGFSPVVSVVAASIGHGWAVTFGSVGSSIYALMAVTGLDADAITPWSAALLGLACIMCGLIPAYLHRGRHSLVHGLPWVLIVGSSMAVVQFFVAASRLWSLSSFVAASVGLVAASAVARMPRYQGSAEERMEGNRRSEEAPRMGVALAFSAYLILLLVIVIARLVPSISTVLDQVSIVLQFPETSTSQGWVNPAGPSRALSVFGHTGALILYSCAISFAIYYRRGCYSSGALGRIARQTVKSSVKPTIGITFLVGMAVFMSDSGMTYSLAQALSKAVGPALPLVAPFIGALGAFVTGSNTNSNVLFGPLQQQSATALGLNVGLILGAQNVGGAIGSVAAPAKVIVGCSTAGLADEEGRVLWLNLVYGLVIVAATGVVTIILSLFV
jgi:lactate permease